MNDAEIALEHNQRGSLHFELGQYAEAYSDFRQAVELAPSDHPHRATYLLNLGNALHCLGRYAEAEATYRLLLAGSCTTPQTKDSAREELRKLAARPRQGTIDLKADDKRLFDVVCPMLADYPLLRKRVNLWWVGRDSPSLTRISDLDERFGVEPEKRVTEITWAALSHFPRGQEHFIFVVKESWNGANDTELRGMLAHELSHEEWKEANLTSLIPDPASSGAALVCNERIADLVTIAKGYGEALLESRLFQERSGSLDLAPVMTALEIAALMTSIAFLR